MDLDHYTLGESNEQQSFDSRIDNREIILHLCRQTRQDIRIFTPDLESPIYDHPDLIRSLTVLATRHRQSVIRILVKDAGQAIKNGHRLIELSRRLTSSIFIHRMPNNIDNRESAYLTADNAGFCHKHAGTLYNGQFNFNDKLKVRDLIKSFDEAWGHSRIDPEMRRLFI